MNPSADDMICDPACGTSGFLIVAAGEWLKENRKERDIFLIKIKKNII